MSTDDPTPRPADDARPVDDAPHRSAPVADGAADEAYDRVRAADPAASATPDLAAIAAKDETVRAHLGDSLGAATTTAPGALGDATGVTPSGEEGTDELAIHRERKRRRVPLLGAVAAGVAGVLAFGVGGYALGNAAGAGGTADASAANAPITLEGAAGAQGAGPEAASDSAALGADARASVMPGWFGGRTVFQASGLGADGTTAPAWAYDAAGVFSAESAARVAAALGVAGEPRQEYGAWTVGPNDGTGASVSLQPDGLASVSFNDPGKDPWACAVVAVPEPGVEEMQTDPQAGCGQKDLGAAPAPDAAISTSKDVLASLGLDPAAFEYTTESYDGEGKILAVSAAQVIEGQRTGNAWSLTYSGAGLSSLYGSLAPTVSIGDYAVVSPTAAVERLGDPRFAGAGMIAYGRSSTMVPLDDVASDIATIEPEAEMAPPTVPPTAGEGAAVSWPVRQVTITEARLGWAVHYQADGGAILVPSYELSDAEGSTWSVIAVADDELDFSATS
jgi:hypothetical protein